MRNSWKWLLAAIILFLLAAADMKYKGLFYKMLPGSVQSFLDDCLN